MSGTKPEQLDHGQPDIELQYLWNLYWELHPFTYQNTFAFSQLTGRTFHHWEISLLNQLGRTINGTVQQ